MLDWTGTSIKIDHKVSLLGPAQAGVGWVMSACLPLAIYTVKHMMGMAYFKEMFLLRNIIQYLLYNLYAGLPSKH